MSNKLFTTRSRCLLLGIEEQVSLTKLWVDSAAHCVRITGGEVVRAKQAVYNSFWASVRIVIKIVEILRASSLVRGFGSISSD